MIVADVNVVAYLLIQGDKTSLAQQVYQQDANWHLPTLWRHEFLNVLATFVRHGGGRINDAQQIWQQGLSLFGGLEQAVDMQQALVLATRHNISAYDAQYLVLASELGVLCISEDQRLVNTFPAQVKPMQKFLNV